jgi:hypothetical protein
MSCAGRRRGATPPEACLLETQEKTLARCESVLHIKTLESAAIEKEFNPKQFGLTFVRDTPKAKPQQSTLDCAVDHARREVCHR